MRIIIVTGAKAALSVLAAVGTGALLIEQQCYAQLAALGCSWAEYSNKFVKLIEGAR